MQIIFDSFINTLFFGAFILIFLVSYLLLRPFKMHRSRRYSTFFPKNEFLGLSVTFSIFCIYASIRREQCINPRGPKAGSCKPSVCNSCLPCSKHRHSSSPQIKEPCQLQPFSWHPKYLHNALSLFCVDDQQLVYGG